MTLSNITSWAEGLTREVYETWYNNFNWWPSGVKVFYSQPRMNPEVMIISYQPGGNEEWFIREDRDRFGRGDFTIPDNEFMEVRYLMARRVQEVFSFPQGQGILKGSVVFPLIFFRAPSVKYWKRQMPRAMRLKAEGFCDLKVREIVEKLKPKKILVIGLGTYNALVKILGYHGQEEVVLRTKLKNHRLAVRGNILGIQVVAVTHLTGARGISGEDRRAISELLARWFKHVKILGFE